MFGADGGGHRSHLFKYSVFALWLSLVLNSVALVLTVSFYRNKYFRKAFFSSSGYNIAFTCLFTLYIRDSYFPRQIIGTLFITAWGCRLSSYLYRRDLETDADLEKTKALTPELFGRVVWSTLIALPIILCNTLQTDVFYFTYTELAGIMICTASLVLETIADNQKANWFLNIRHDTTTPCVRYNRPTKDSVQPPVCNNGLWNYSRHPNLFFEVCFHWGIYCIVKPVDIYWIVAVPILNTLAVVVFGGGGDVMSLERTHDTLYQLYPAYWAHKQSTSPFIPMPKFIYRFLGHIAPTTCCADLRV